MTNEVETLAELRAKRASTIDAAAELLAAETRTIDAEIAEAAAAAEAAKARAAAERAQAATAALIDAEQVFSVAGARLAEALTAAPASTDRDHAVLEVIKMIERVKAALHKSSSGKQRHTYCWSDASETVVVRDDGATFPWPKDDGPNSKRGHCNPSNLPYSQVTDQFHDDGNPWPEPYKGSR